MLSREQLDLRSEDCAIASIHRSFMKGNNRSLYVACEDIDFHWNIHQVRQFDKMWRKGIEYGTPSKDLIFYIANKFDRSPEEVAILVIDRGMKGII
ncbi:hypothetical protein [Metabacillus sp. Hm71]|uniref:hypothetical protein n=1 Tax=Metabacillus sp. Hm71 TaxID=3450743 RepID=UPI003F427480